jgi:hypothetical protein
VTARRNPAAHLSLRVGSRFQVAFVPFPARAPMFVIGAGGALVSVTLPEQVEAGHVDFARQLAIAAMLEGAAADVQARAARFAGRQRDHTPTKEDPFVVVLVDEVAFLTAWTTRGGCCTP